MSQENVEVTTRLWGTLIQNIERHWKEPRSYAEDLRADTSGPGSRAVLELMHPDVRWTDALGTVNEGKLACARHIDALLESSRF